MSVKRSLPRFLGAATLTPKTVSSPDSQKRFLPLRSFVEALALGCDAALPSRIVFSSLKSLMRFRGAAPRDSVLSQLFEDRGSSDTGLGGKNRRRDTAFHVHLLQPFFAAVRGRLPIASDRGEATPPATPSIPTYWSIAPTDAKWRVVPQSSGALFWCENGLAALQFVDASRHEGGDARP